MSNTPYFMLPYYRATQLPPARGYPPGDTYMSLAFDPMLDVRKPRLSEEETTVLMNEFEVNPRPGKQRRLQLACQIGTSPRRVQIWFQNARAKRLRQQRENDSHEKQPQEPRDESLSPDSGIGGGLEGSLSDSGEASEHPWLDISLPVDSPVLGSKTSPGSSNRSPSNSSNRSSSNSSNRSSSDSLDTRPTSPKSQTQSPVLDKFSPNTIGSPRNMIATDGGKFTKFDAVYKHERSDFLFLRDPSPEGDFSLQTTHHSHHRPSHRSKSSPLSESSPVSQSSSPQPIHSSPPTDYHTIPTSTAPDLESSPPSPLHHNTQLPKPKLTQLKPTPAPVHQTRSIDHTATSPNLVRSETRSQLPRPTIKSVWETPDPSETGKKTARRYSSLDQSEDLNSRQGSVLASAIYAPGQARPGRSRRRFRPQYPYTRHNFPNNMPDLPPLDSYLSYLASLDPATM